MLQQLSLKEFKALSHTAQTVAVFKEIMADRLTTVGIVEALRDEMAQGTVLESGLQRAGAGHYSFIAFDSMAQFSVQNQVVSQCVGGHTSILNTAPFPALRKLITQLTPAMKPNMMDLASGIMGYITYDAVRLFEAIPDRHNTGSHLPEIAFNFYRTTLVLDHVQQKLLINTLVEVGENAEASYLFAQEKIEKLITQITSHAQPNKEQTTAKQASPVQTDLSDAEFIERVEKAKHYIREGDAFQIVLSRRFTKSYTAAPFDIYRALRKVSPSPYMFYFPIKGGAVVGASPEKLISVNQGRIIINPIAGTRRHTPDSDDRKIELDLLSDEKELAEHRMLVDLARNDIGAVSQTGSIQIDELLQVKHYSHVSHITSSISGQLRPEFDALDAIAAVFPAGTLSGAPKIRAMEIIDELETSRRDLYGGAICRLDYRGNLDSCIAIRMATLKNGIATVRTGAGIVYDSNPQAEANETGQKAQSVLDAISFAEAHFQ
jgi:anthranilate synthase component 1